MTASDLPVRFAGGLLEQSRNENERLKKTAPGTLD